MIDNFLMAEEKNGLLEDDIDGFKYWFFVRDKIYNRILGLVKTEAEGGASRGLYNIVDKMVGSDDLSHAGEKVHVSTVFRFIKNILFPNYLLAGQKDILIFTSPRRVKEFGKYKSIYTDYIPELFPDKCISAEFPNGIMHLCPSYSKPLLELDRIDVVPFIKGEISKKLFKKKKIEFDERAIRISEIISREININIDSKLISNMIETRYYWYKYKVKIFQRLIKRIQPRVIIEIGGYGRNTLIINEIAKGQGIPTIELQHGIIGSGHVAYNYLVERSYVNLPDYLCVFSDYWRDTCRFPIEKNNIIATGFPYFEGEKHQNSKVEDNKLINAVIISQPIFGDEVIDFCKELLSLIPEDRYMLHLKLHPLEYNRKNEIEKIFIGYSNIIVHDDSLMNLYELFALCDIQIGISSTSIYEGLGFGLTTIILKIGDSEKRVMDLIANKYAVLVNNARECFELFMNGDLSNTNRINPDYFFKPNSKDNIARVIKRFL